MRYISKLLLMQLLLFNYSACAEGNIEKQKLISSDNVEYLKVVGVGENDTLSLRVSGSSKSEIVFKMPYNAAGMIKLKELK